MLQRGRTGESTMNNVPSNDVQAEFIDGGLLGILFRYLEGKKINGDLHVKSCNSVTGDLPRWFVFRNCCSNQERKKSQQALCLHFLNVFCSEVSVVFNLK